MDGEGRALRTRYGSCLQNVVDELIELKEQLGRALVSEGENSDIIGLKSRFDTKYDYAILQCQELESLITDEDGEGEQKREVINQCAQRAIALKDLVNEDYERYLANCIFPVDAATAGPSTTLGLAGSSVTHSNSSRSSRSSRNSKSSLKLAQVKAEVELERQAEEKLDLVRNAREEERRRAEEERRRAEEERRRAEEEQRRRDEARSFEEQRLKHEEERIRAELDRQKRVSAATIALNNSRASSRASSSSSLGDGKAEKFRSFQKREGPSLSKFEHVPLAPVAGDNACLFLGDDTVPKSLSLTCAGTDRQSLDCGPHFSRRRECSPISKFRHDPLSHVGKDNACLSLGDNTVPKSHSYTCVGNGRQSLDCGPHFSAVHPDDGPNFHRGPKRPPQVQSYPYRHERGSKSQALQEKSNSDDSTGLIELAKSIKKLAENSVRPHFAPREVDLFDGSPMQYHRFIRHFETYVINGVTDPCLKLSYLISSCKGKARESIKNTIMELNPEAGYREARLILQQRFGRTYDVIGTQLKKLTGGPKLKPHDVDGLVQLAQDLKDCEITCRGRSNTGLDTRQTVGDVFRRLPTYLQERFCQRVTSKLKNDQLVTFAELAEFVQEAAHSKTSFLGQIMSERESKPYLSTDKQMSKARVFSTQNSSREKVTEEDKKGSEYVDRRPVCPLCSSNHGLWRCQRFLDSTAAERRKDVINSGCCFNCLGRHKVKDCVSEGRCKQCKGKHHTLIHQDRSSGEQDSHKGTARRVDGVGGAPVGNVNKGIQTSFISSTHTVTSFGTVRCRGSRVRLKVVPVLVQAVAGGRAVETYAFLDEGSDATLCSERLLRKLGLKGERVYCSVDTINGLRQQAATKVTLAAKGIGENEVVQLGDVYAISKLPDLHSSIPKRADSALCPHTRDIAFHELQCSDIDLLIGADVQPAHIAKECRRGLSGQPTAIHTGLGWTLVGPQSSYASNQKQINFIRVDNAGLHQQLEKMYRHDFTDLDEMGQLEPSVDDRRALSIMERTITKVNGHFQIALPWRPDCDGLPNNRGVAEKRLTYLHRKLKGCPELHRQYCEKIEEYLEGGHAEKIPESSLAPTPRTWYLPHHSTGGKFRIVFDCAAKYRGTSLNDQLLSGPDLTNNLVGVLLRFRLYSIAITADIKGMFHQVKVNPKDSDSFRFLWWPNGDLSSSPEEYRMLVHLFGATSSPSCAAYALRKVGEEARTSFADKDLSYTIERNFYVDDWLKSVRNSSEASELVSKLKHLLKRNGFHLTKFLSNSGAALEAIPAEDKATSFLDLDLEGGSGKALGLVWDTVADSIKVKVKIETKPSTRRGILSMISQVYDPLGWVQPFLLPVKQLMQELCSGGLGWDDSIPEEQLELWYHWVGSLHHLDGMEMQRCIIPDNFRPQSIQLHCFCDASKDGYGAVAYLRMQDASGFIRIRFIMGKSRVTPVKPVTIPRLELTAAVVGVKLAQFIKRELDMVIDDIVYWTDATAVLQYIRNTARRFETFIANRLAIIQGATSVSQWRHVDSKRNPADLASRGVMPDKVDRAGMWTNGPEFLGKNEEEWPSCPLTFTTEVEGSTECNRNFAIQTTDYSVPTEDPLNQLLAYFSSFTKLRLAVAWFLCYKRYLRMKCNRTTRGSVRGIAGVMVQDLQQAELEVAKLVQGECFSSELSALRTGELSTQRPGARKLKQSSIARLNPFIKDGVIRVGGRLHNASVCYDVRHPVLLPSKHRVTDLIVMYFHVREGHSGSLHTLAATREKFWVIKGHSTVRRVLGDCRSCRLTNAPTGKQVMAPLPQVRVSSNTKMFCNVGVDYAGPFLTKRGRSSCKRYLCVFTCMASRGVHLELAYSLETSSYLQVLQRFINRRGRPSTITSDNGTNFVGAEKVLRLGIKQWNKEHIRSSMQQEGIEWRFNTPRASHYGGVWERLIRSIRRIMNSIVGERQLTDEELTTLLTTVERIMNDRPLTPVGDDPADLQTLSPSALLLGKLDTDLPMGVFMKADGYKKSWRHVNYVADQFWHRWLKEYLPTLQVRQKWLKPVRNFAVGDVVLVKDEGRPRGVWPKALIEKVFPGSDGKIRTVKLKTAKSTFIRDIRKICLLEAAE